MLFQNYSFDLIGYCRNSWGIINIGIRIFDGFIIWESEGVIFWFQPTFCQDSSFLSSFICFYKIIAYLYICVVFPVFRINADWILSSLLRDEDCICSVLLFKDQLAIDIRHLRFVTKHQVLYRYWNNFRSYLKEKYYHAPGESWFKNIRKSINGLPSPWICEKCF